MFRLLAALGLLGTLGFALATPVHAQTATLSGRAVDESGGVLPGATVELVGTAGRLTTVTSPSGDYSFRDVTNGTYQLTLSLVGFSQATRDNIVVAGSNVEIPPITLTLGRLGETVVVSASKLE